MDQIFDRLGNLLKSVFQEGETESVNPDSFSDPDMQSAWEELDDFMNEEPKSSGNATYGTPRNDSPPEEIRNAYEVLGVPENAQNAEIGKSYKSLLLKHHPDRFATDPQKMAKATERTKRINNAFNLIKTYRTSNSS